MNRKLMASAAAAVLLGMFPGAANAQHGSGAGANAPVPSAPRGDLDRTRDRLCAPGDICDQDRDRLRDKDRTGDMDQDRDRLNSSQAIDDQLARYSLLTSAERVQFRDEMRAARTTEERERIRARHQRTIEERAREMGIDAPLGAGSGAGAGYGTRSGYMLMTMLTDQERAGFRSRMQAAGTEQERQQIRNEIHAMARQRARELGVEVPEWYGRGAGSR